MTKIYKLKDEGQYNAAFELFDQMKEQGLADKTIYSTILSMCRLANNLDLAIKYFNDLVKEGMVTTKNINAMISVYCHFGEIHNAVDLFRSIEPGYNLKADNRTYSTLMTGYNRIERYADAEYMWEELLMKRLAPDKRAYTAYLTAVASQGKLEKVLKILEEMKSIHFEIDDILIISLYSSLKKSGNKNWNHLMDALVKYSDDKHKIIFYNFKIDNAENLEEGIKILEEAKLHSTPNNITYTLLMRLNGCTYENCLNFYNDFKESGYGNPDSGLLNMMLFHATVPPKAENQEHVDHVLSLFSSNTRLPLKTYELLFAYHFSLKNTKKMEELKNKLKKSHKIYTPNIYAYLIEYSIANNDAQSFMYYLEQAIDNSVRLHTQTCYLSLYTLIHTRLSQPFVRLLRYMTFNKIIYDDLAAFNALMHFMDKESETLYDYIYEAHRVAVENGFSDLKFTYWAIVMKASCHYNNATNLARTMSDALDKLKKKPQVLKQVIEEFLSTVEKKTPRFQMIIAELRESVAESEILTFHTLSKLNVMLKLMNKSPQWNKSLDPVDMNEKTSQRFVKTHPHRFDPK